MIATCNTEKGHDIFLVLAAPRLYHSHNCPERKLMFLSRDAKAALLAPCNAANCTAMGIETDIFPARGTFYVATQAKTPYCIQDPKIDFEMVDSLYKLYSTEEGPK